MKEDYETLKEKSCTAASEYLLNYLLFSEEKYKDNHECIICIMNVL